MAGLCHQLSWLGPVLLMACACTKTDNPKPASEVSDPAKGVASMRIESSAFQHNGEIPSVYTCEGEDKSPPLSWSGAPAGTKSFALVVDDPDAPDPAAPKRVWVHWVMYDIPARVTSLPEATKTPPSGARDGQNDWGKPGWGGPCPPIGRHRYFHKIYALDTLLGERGQLKKAELEAAIKGHVLAQGELIGTYQKKK
jgi:Raf kinase inhibitor-like YbhB/YbcL family protein